MDSETRATAQDLLDPIFRLTTELVRGERASLMLRDEGSSDFVMACALGLAEEVRRQVRVREGEGIVGRVAKTRRSLLVGQDGEDPPSGGGPGQYRTRSFVSVPILVGEDLRGVLSVADPVDGPAFAEGDLRRLELLAQHVATCLADPAAADRFDEEQRSEAPAAIADRRQFDRRLEGEAHRAKRSGHLLALLLVDVNGFGEINERYGREAGDRILAAVGDTLARSVRVYDLVTRFGADEFAILLPDSDTQGASRVARRILDRVAALDLPPAMVEAGAKVTLSIGAATYPTPAADVAALLDAADAAMYRAKRAGGGLRVWQHSFGLGPKGRTGAAERSQYTPYLADPGKLATAELQALIPPPLAAEWNAVVVGRDGPVLTVAMPAPSDAAVDALSKASGCAVYPVYSRAEDLEGIRRRIIAG